MGSWNALRVTGLKGTTGEDGDFGILTLSFSGSSMSLQGNGQADGYVIYNNTKFYMNSVYTCTTSGDGVIIADISQTPVVVTYKKITVTNELLSFVDFNTGTDPITKADVDSQWQYILIGEFSCLSDGTIINALLKPTVPMSTFLSNEFTSILRKATLGQNDIEAWSKAMGCDEYYNALAVSKLFAGQIFTQELTLTDGGVIKSATFNDDVGFSLSANGTLLAKSATITGNTVLSGSAVIDLGDAEDALLRTQYGSDNTGSVTVDSKTRWRVSDFYNSFNNTREYGTVSYNDGTKDYSNFQYNEGYFDEADPYLFLVIIDEECFYHTNESQTISRSFIVGLTETYSIYFDLNNENGVNSSIEVFRNGISISYQTQEKMLRYDLVEGDNIEIVLNTDSGPSDKYLGYTVYIYKSSLFLYNRVSDIVTDIIEMPNGTDAYENRLILLTCELYSENTFDSNNYINLAPINGWYNGLVDNQILPCTNASLITFNGTSYTVKYVSRTIGTFKIITTTGITISMLAPSTTDEPSSIGWYDISGTIYFNGETRGLLTGSLIPVSDNNDIGDAANRYNTIFSKTINSTEVSATTANIETINATLANITTLALDVPSSFSSGYAIMPNGLMIQWGRTVLAANSRQYYNFPITFVTGGTLTATGDWRDYDGWATCGGVYDGNTGYYLFNANNTSREVDWIAVGY